MLQQLNISNLPRFILCFFVKLCSDQAKENMKILCDECRLFFELSLSSPLSLGMNGTITVSMTTNLRLLEQTDPNPSVPVPSASAVGQITDVS